MYIEEGITMAKIIYDGNGVSRGIKEAYEAHKYIVCYRSAYQPFYSEVQGSYYAKQVYSSSVNLVGAWKVHTRNRGSRESADWQ